MIKRRSRSKVTGLMITPMIDMFTVILIFLIVSYAPDEARVKKSEELVLPKSELQISKMPKIQIQVTDTDIRLNGSRIEGIKPNENNSKSWAILKEALNKNFKDKRQPVLLIADKDTSYAYIDRAVGFVAAAGFGEVYFLTETVEEK